MKDKLKRLWRWLRANVLNKDMFLWVLIAEVIFWSPCIVTGLLALIINPWWWTAFGAIIAFWSGPFTPAVPIQIAFAIALKKIHDKIKAHRKSKRGKENDEGTENKAQ